jgi:putative YphP/YqiW family bacilliredoxin
VDAALDGARGTTLVVVNSVCGCAARNARPAVAEALRHAVRPARVVTLFPGQDREATERARGYFTGHAPSSPSMALLKDGARPPISHSVSNTCWAPAVKNLVLQHNSIYNGWRLEDVWLDK